MSVVNADYYAELVKQIDSATSCAALQAQTNTIVASLKEQLAQAEAQLAKVQPVLALLTPPTSPDDVIGWIQVLIDSVITPLAAPATTYTAQIAAMTVGIADVINAINAKAADFQNCEITPP